MTAGKMLLGSQTWDCVLWNRARIHSCEYRTLQPTPLIFFWGESLNLYGNVAETITSALTTAGPEFIYLF